MEYIKVGNIPVHLFSEDDLNKTILKISQNKEKKTIFHANAYLIELANSKHNWLIDYFNSEVDYVMCDGSGIQFGAKLTNQKIPQKIAYNTWFWRFVKFCKEHELSIYLLGAKPGIADQAATNLIQAAPGIKIHANHGYFNKEKGSIGNSEVIEKINIAKPDILLVCFGMPTQELWVKENFQEIEAHTIMTGGGALDFFSGKVEVAPVIFSTFYLEWLFRLLQEPKRLWRRYLIGNFKLIYYVLKYKK